MTANRKALNRWARFAGYSDFDTYIRTGGSILDARSDIRHRIATLEKALAALNVQIASQPGPEPEPNPAFDRAHDSHAAIGELDQQPQAEALILEHDEPTDPDNAHIQGAEHEP